MSRFRVLSWNIHKGRSFAGQSKTLDLVRTLLKSHDVDFVFLQEIQGKSESTWHLKSPNLDEAKIFESQLEFLADEAWPHFSYGQNASFSDRHHGNAILSKWPIIHEKNHDLTLTRFEHRGLLGVKSTLQESGQIELYSTHLNLLHGHRKRQVNSILEILDHHLGPSASAAEMRMPVVLAGDFNDWSLGLHQGLIDCGFREAFEETGQKLAETYPSFYPSFKLDRIYFLNLKCISAKVITDPFAMASDHLPIYAEFEPLY